MAHAIYPKLVYINAITNAQQAVATFTEDHDFTLGEIVSFRVTPAFGMFQINNKRGRVLALTSDTITVDIDTTNWDAFDYSALDTDGTTPPVCVPSSSWIVPNTNNPVQINQAAAFDNRRT